ncbi:hypothetical protein [Tellurirhabdus bombi]|uniref:hypothetical protein n=1 Tax=Tellurirhabdus bombi TaxID=2907205 RepID=UPI001F15F7BD|nr:hypothetical protein [Tellurirhabdus bombi]
MNRNRRILFIGALIFTLIVAWVAVDMARRTTAPWNKRRQLERALPPTMQSDGTSIDTMAVDTVGIDPR